MDKHIIKGLSNTIDSLVRQYPSATRQEQRKYYNGANYYMSQLRKEGDPRTTLYYEDLVRTVMRYDYNGNL